MVNSAVIGEGQSVDPADVSSPIREAGQTKYLTDHCDLASLSEGKELEVRPGVEKKKKKRMTDKELQTDGHPPQGVASCSQLLCAERETDKEIGALVDVSRVQG